MPGPAAEVDDTFTYQGQLSTGDGPANGLYDFSFRLYTAPTGGGGSPVTAITNSAVAVSNGWFITSINFNATNLFDGTAYWLSIQVRTNGSTGGFTALQPRQLLVATPYASYARNAALATAATALQGNGAVAGTNILNATITSANLASDIGVWTQTPDGIFYNGGGNVGIGTTTPGTTLEVHGDAAHGGVAIRALSDKPWGAQIAISATNVANGHDWRLTSTGGTAVEGQGKLVFRDGTTGFDALVIATNGDVNLGTVSNYDLTVASRVLAIAGDTNAAYYPGTAGLALDDTAGNVWGLATFTDGNLHIFKAAGAGGGNTLVLPTVSVAGEVTCTAMNVTSDRVAKEGFQPVDAREVLEKVTRLPITQWQYKTQADARHIGPMAQDFHSAFGVGRDDKHIATVDEEGVALAAIQGLNEKLEERLREKEGHIEALEDSVAELKQRVNELAARLKEGAK